jgi:hypothetical protein
MNHTLIPMINHTTLKKNHNIFVFDDVKIHFTFVSFVEGNTI